MLSTRSPSLRLAALVALVLLAALRTLSHSPDVHLIAGWWISTAVATVVFVLASRRQLPLVVGAVLFGLLAMSHLSGHTRFFSITFTLANVAEAAIVAWWLTRGGTKRPDMHSWSDFFIWLRAVATACAVAASAISVTMYIDAGSAPWRTFAWVFITHLGAQSVILPLALHWPAHEHEVTQAEQVAHLGLLAVVTGLCFKADASEPVAFLLLPLLLWSAARFSNRWTNFELLGTAAGIAFLTAADHGPFHSVTGEINLLQIAASSQTFIAVCGVAVVAFSVAVNHLMVTLRQNAEHEVQLKQLLDSASGTAFIVTDPDGTITLFSPGAELLLGYRAEEVVGRSTPIPFHDRREIHQRARELGIAPDYRVVTKALEDGADQEVSDWTYVCKDRTRLSVSLNATAVRDSRGKPLRYLNIVRDVTDRRAAEQALVFALDKERETTHRMLEIDRIKDEFISTVSHELRTPLTSIMGYTELLTDGISGDLNEPQLDLVERIERNSERLLRLVEDLLTLARFEQDELPAEKKPTDLRSAVTAATRQTAFAASRRGVTVHVAIPKQPAIVEGNASDLERLAVNLVDNAVKFSPVGGTVQVTLDVHGDVGRLTVHDDGVGIPPDEQDQLFRRFFRSSISSHLEIQGTGLGLSIVQAVVDAHHGHVMFESSPGAGTTFVASLPLAPVVVDVPEEVDSAPAEATAGATAGATAEFGQPQR